MTFEARILGPVEASRDGRPVPLGSPKQRAVFALLVLNGGKVVSTDRFVSELWGDDPPGSPISTLQVYISRLRRSMGSLDGDGADGVTPHGSVSLVRRSPGYQLTLPEGAVDADRFRELVSRARSHLHADPAGARSILEHALELQRGSALADVLDVLGPNAAAEAQRLDDLWLTAQQLRLEAMLANGDAVAAAADAAALVREHPLREGLHAVLMLALYRSGRQAEALQAFEAVRNELDQQLGVDPGPALRELQLQILRQDPQLSPALPEPRPAPVESGPDAVLERHESVPSHVPGPATGWVPEPLTTLVGREQDVGDVAASLARGRLTSLTGTGGAGKTRLALAVVTLVRAAYPAGVWWVDLSTVTDPDSVARLVAAAIGGRELADRPLLQSAVAQIGAGVGLLILDNCEHLAGASAEAVHQLLLGCRGLRVLVTTREPLGVPGERVWPVQPLGVLPDGRTPSFAEVAESPATQLWCERASTALPGFELTEDNAPLVARICRQLDGLPLAIELASARLRVLSLEEIAEALDRQLEVLAGHDRSAAERHQTLRATLDWSFRLLSEDEQELLATLSVFQGGFTLDAVTAVRQTRTGAASTLDLVSRLIDRSLVSIADRGRPTRYRLLETVRRYASDVLSATGQTSEVSSRHLRYFAELAELAEPHLRGSSQRDWLGRLDTEVANFVAAMHWSVGAGHAPEDGLRLVSALWHFWYLRGHYAAGRQWLDRALDAAPDAHRAAVAKALAAAGQLAYLQCDYLTSAERLSSAQVIFADLGDTLGVATVLQSLGCVAREQGDYPRSRGLHTDSERRWRAAGHPDGVARSANYLGFVAWLEGDPVLAREQSSRGLAFFQTSGDGEGLAWSLLIQGAAAAYAGDLLAADTLLDESRRRSEVTGYREGVAWSLNQLGVVAGRRADWVEARSLQRASLREHWQLSDLWRTASVLEALAAAENRDGQHHWAVHLLGAAVAVRARLNAPIPPVEGPDVDAAISRLRSVVGAAAFDAALAAGGAAGLEQTVRHELVRTG